MGNGRGGGLNEDSLLVNIPNMITDLELSWSLANNSWAENL